MPTVTDAVSARSRRIFLRRGRTGCPRARASRRTLEPTLSGLELEYRIVRLSSHDSGLREVSLVFGVGQGLGTWISATRWRSCSTAAERGEAR